MLNLHQISKTDPILQPTLYKSIEDNRVFKKAEYRESFIKNINNLLSLRDSRQTALSTLNIFCDHHSIVNSPLVTEKTCPEINWIEQLLRIIEQEPQCHADCFDILAKLLKITSCNPDTNKIVQSKYVQKIIDAVVGSSVSPQHSLACLATCFELHGGTSGIYKNKIYEYCVSFIDVPDNQIANCAAFCLHLLQQSRGGSVAGGVYKKCWSEFHDRTLGSLEEILEQIVKKNSSVKIGKSEQLQLPELKLSPEPFNMYTQLFVRFQNVVTILRVTLKRSFTTAKSIQVSRIVAFIEEGIGMSHALVGKKAITESVVLSLLHGQIYVNLLEILRSLILSLKQNIITHSKTICDSLWRCLKQTNGHEQTKFDANLKLRAATYETLICFMRISPNNVHVKNIMENLMKEALIDITPANDEICLMMPQTNGGKSNKRKKVNAEKKMAKGRTHLASLSDEQKVCAKALECLGFLLVYHGVLMKPVLFFVMQEKLVSIAFMISSKIQQDGDLYRNPICRSRLTDVIGFMMIHPVNKMPVPINYGIALLTKFKQNDPDANVRDNAAMNLYRAETAIHNRKDVFYFPADYRDLRDTLLFNKQTVQKFNESTNGQKSNDEGEKMEADENVVISDNDSVEEIVDDESEVLNPPQATDEVNEISDESEVEAETQEISDDEEEIPQEENLEEPSAENIRRSSRHATVEKRPSPSEQQKSSPKKQKISDKKDDELVDEMLADFNE